MVIPAESSIFTLFCPTFAGHSLVYGPCRYRSLSPGTNLWRGSFVSEAFSWGRKTGIGVAPSECDFTFCPYSR